MINFADNFCSFEQGKQLKNLGFDDNDVIKIIGLTYAEAENALIDRLIEIAKEKR